MALWDKPRQYCSAACVNTAKASGSGFRVLISMVLLPYGFCLCIDSVQLACRGVPPLRCSGGILNCGCDHFAHGKSDRERCATAFSFAAGLDDSAVQFDQMTGDRQAQSQTACRAADHGFSLAETIEYVREELLTDSSAGVADGELGFRAGVFQFDSNDSSGRREFHRVR